MSAVLKENYVETIFDHGVTDAELSELMLESKNDYLYSVDQDTAYVDLYWLYDLRGDVNKAHKYLDSIQDSKYRNSVTMTCCHN
ncbi:MAG: hypothetical protein QX195_04800 [Methylococcaceae bacterium]|jgi:hypothetical protein